MTYDEFMEIVRKTNSSREVRGDMTEAEKLRYRAYYLTKTDAEWLQLEKDIQEYMESNPPESEKKILFDFSEMIGMRCSAIRLKEKQSENTVK